MQEWKRKYKAQEELPKTDLTPPTLTLYIALNGMQEWKWKATKRGEG